MTRTEDLDWLADDEGNLRPEAAEALEADPELGDVVRPDPPGEVQSARRWVFRAFIIVGALWIVISFIEWVLLLCFIVGLGVRLSRWAAREGRGSLAGGAERRTRTTVRRPAEEIPLYGPGQVPPRDPDPELVMEE